MYTERMFWLSQVPCPCLLLSWNNRPQQSICMSGGVLRVRDGHLDEVVPSLISMFITLSDWTASSMALSERSDHFAKSDILTPDVFQFTGDSHVYRYAFSWARLTLEERMPNKAAFLME